MTVSVSLIIPLAPGEAFPEPLADRLLDHNHGDEQVELLVAASGELPDTLSHRVRIVHSEPGRGRQMNQAAEQARGHWLWFIHSDSRLPANALKSVLDFTAANSKCIGYCRLRFADDGPVLTRLNAMGANLRSRWLGLPYGDQALCLPTACFRQLGGFREDLARGEDLDLVVRAARIGVPARPLGLTVTTSARRYREQGWLRTTWNHQLSARRLIKQARRQGAKR